MELQSGSRPASGTGPRLPYSLLGPLSWTRGKRSALAHFSRSDPIRTSHRVRGTHGIPNVAAGHESVEGCPSWGRYGAGAPAPRRAPRRGTVPGTHPGPRGPCTVSWDVPWGLGAPCQVLGTAGRACRGRAPLGTRGAPSRAPRRGDLGEIRPQWAGPGHLRACGAWAPASVGTHGLLGHRCRTGRGPVPRYDCGRSGRPSGSLGAPGAPGVQWGLVGILWTPGTPVRILGALGVT